MSASDEIYKYDRQQQQSLLAAKPWDKDPHFFKDIKISALALLKMVMHARSGGNLEIMGLLLGKVRNEKKVLKKVSKGFSLPNPVHSSYTSFWLRSLKNFVLFTWDFLGSGHVIGSLDLGLTKYANFSQSDTDCYQCRDVDPVCLHHFWD